MNIKFNPTSFSLIKKILDKVDCFFKKPQLSKLNNKHPISNMIQSNEEYHSSHDYSRMGFLDDCNVIHSNHNHSIKDKNPIGIVSNRDILTSNSDAIVLPITSVLQNYPTISLKEVYENLVKSNTAKLKTYQLFEKMYEQHQSCRGKAADVFSNNSSNIEKSLSNPLSELYPIHYFKNIEELSNHSEDLDLSKNTNEAQKLDISDLSDSNNLDNLTDIEDSNNGDHTDSSLLTVAVASDNVSDTDSYQVMSCIAESITPSYAPSFAVTLTDMSIINHNDVEHTEIVLDDCSEEMQTLVSNFSLNLKSVTDHNPIELTVKHPLFSVSYENNPYFSIKYTPHIGYNSLMELEQDKELMIFPLCFYIKSVSSTQDNTNYKVFFLLEEQIDEDNDLSLDYVDNVHSGRIGLIYVSKSDIRKQYNVKRITQKIQDEVKLEAIRFVQLLNQ